VTRRPKRFIDPAAAHCFVEHDDPADPMRSIETSLAYVRKLDI